MPFSQGPGEWGPSWVGFQQGGSKGAFWSVRNILNFYLGGGSVGMCMYKN